MPHHRRPHRARVRTTAGMSSRRARKSATSPRTSQGRTVIRAARAKDTTDRLSEGACRWSLQYGRGGLRTHKTDSSHSLFSEDHMATRPRQATVVSPPSLPWCPNDQWSLKRRRPVGDVCPGIREGSGPSSGVQIRAAQDPYTARTFVRDQPRSRMTAATAAMPESVDPMHARVATRSFGEIHRPRLISRQRSRPSFRAKFCRLCSRT